MFSSYIPYHDSTSIIQYNINSFIRLEENVTVYFVIVLVMKMRQKMWSASVVCMVRYMDN